MLESILVVEGSVLIVMMLPLLYRAVVGPTSVDRLIGVNLIGTQTTLLLLLLGLLFGRIDMFVDLALTYAMLNFLGSLGAARLLERLGPLGKLEETEEPH